MTIPGATPILSASPKIIPVRRRGHRGRGIFLSGPTRTPRPRSRRRTNFFVGWALPRARRGSRRSRTPCVTMPFRWCASFVIPPPCVIPGHRRDRSSCTGCMTYIRSSTASELMPDLQNDCFLSAHSDREPRLRLAARKHFLRAPSGVGAQVDGFGTVRWSRIGGAIGSGACGSPGDQNRMSGGGPARRSYKLAFMGWTLLECGRFGRTSGVACQIYTWSRLTRRRIKLEGIASLLQGGQRC